MTGGDEPTHTPQRRFRLEDQYWYPAMAKARGEGTTISALIRGWVIGYLRGER